MFNAKQKNKLKRLLHNSPEGSPEKPPESSPEKAPKRRDRSQELAEKSRSQLSFSRFRAVNEFLYSHSSSEANNYLSEDLFTTYHKTYEELVKKWPKKPIDCVIELLQKRVKNDEIIADIGCGNRPQIKEALPHNSVHSFDLVSSDPNIIAAEMTELPIGDKSVDVCVYCLSLMATDLSVCILEANRVLRKGGTLLIAEVTSRFDSNEELFVKRLHSLGFDLKKKQSVTDFFVIFEFRKTRDSKKRDKNQEIYLKPCFYKLR